MILIAWESPTQLFHANHLSVLDNVTRLDKLRDYLSPDDWVLFIPANFQKSFWFDDTNVEHLEFIENELLKLRRSVEGYDWVMIQWKPNYPSSRLQKAFIESVEGFHGDDIEEVLQIPQHEDFFHFPPDKWEGIREKWPFSREYPWEPGAWFWNRPEQGLQFMIRDAGSNVSNWPEFEKRNWSEWMRKCDEQNTKKNGTIFPGSWYAVQHNIDWPHTIIGELRNATVSTSQWVKTIPVDKTITYFIHAKTILSQLNNISWNTFFDPMNGNLSHGVMEIQSWQAVRCWWSEQLGLKNRDIWNECMRWEEIWRPTYHQTWISWRKNYESTKFIWSPLQNESSFKILQPQEINAQTREFIDFQSRTIPDKLRLIFLETLGGNDPLISVYRTSSLMNWNVFVRGEQSNIFQERLNYLHGFSKTHFVFAWIWDYMHIPFIFQETPSIPEPTWLGWIMRLLRKTIEMRQYYQWREVHPIFFVAIPERGWRYFRDILRILVGDKFFQGVIWWPLVGYPIYTTGDYSHYEYSTAPPNDWLLLFGTHALEKTQDMIDTLGEIPSPPGQELKLQTTHWRVPMQSHVITDARYGFYEFPCVSKGGWVGYCMGKPLDSVNIDYWCRWIARRIRENENGMRWFLGEREMEMLKSWKTRLSRTGFPLIAIFDYKDEKFCERGWGGHSWTAIVWREYMSVPPSGFCGWLRNQWAPNVFTWVEGVEFWKSTSPFQSTLPDWFPVLFSGHMVG